jgi:hypothetical protein
MGSILDALRAGIKVADQVTKPLQPIVLYEQVTGKNEYGVFQYASPYSMHAIVEEHPQRVPTREGILTEAKATLTLLSILELVVATSGEGIGVNDRFTDTRNRKWLVVALGPDVIDAGTGIPLVTTVYLG